MPMYMNDLDNSAVFQNRGIASIVDDSGLH
jgi:hypothetical protein